MSSLFGDNPPPPPRRREFDQWFTPRWAAQELVDQFYGDLGAGDLVLEPSCGDGSFLQAIGDEIPAIGVEIDPAMAQLARDNTGREVIVGDFRTVDLPAKPTLILGNPPFNVRLFDEFLDRSRALLPDNGRCGFLMSVHAIQTPSTVLRWNDHWSIDQRLVPRTLFPRAIRPLVFLMFTKDHRRCMAGGFALYHACAEISRLKAGRIRLLLVNGEPRKSCWRAVVEYALGRLGGKGRIDEIYAVVEPRRPTENQWWREKVRQTLQRYFDSVERGVWQIRIA